MRLKTMRLNRTTAFLLGAAVTAALAPTAAVASGGDDHGNEHPARELLSARLVGSLPDDAPLFGVVPGGAPWDIARGTVELRTDGRITVRIRGLVIPPAGTNPLPRLAASVACNGMVVATTRTVFFSRPTGNARISQRVMLPARCLAPAVLINPVSPVAPDPSVPNVGVYIAATGGVR